MSPVQAIKRTHPCFKLKQSTPKQVNNLLMSLPNGKANSIDMILNKMLKIDIFNCCTSMNTFPDDLKVAKVVPIFKAGAKDDPGNCRSISILSSVARVFEKLIYGQLYHYFSSSNFLGKQQWGFRKMHSTVLALQSTTNNWILNMDNGRANAVIFLDLKKAFDTVNHDIIVQKLHCYGITGDELKFLRSYLSNRKQCCSVNGRVSDYEDIACGVPQGSILGPLLFIIYMNDLPTFVKDSIISMYADDTGLSSKISNAFEINSELLPDFLKANKLSLNIVKNEHTIIGTSQKLMQLGTVPKIKVNNTLLKRVPHTKSLGLVIDETLSWVNRYCNTIWGQCQNLLLDKLQTLQNKAARIVAGKSYKEADHTKLLQEFGWLNVRKLICLDLGISMFKINKGDAPEAILEMFRHNDYSYNTRSVASDNFSVNMTHLSIGKTPISYIGPKLWNSIPRLIKQSESLERFKNNFKDYLMLTESSILV